MLRRISFIVEAIVGVAVVLTVVLLFTNQPEQAPAVNTIHQAPKMRSSLLVPLLPELPPMAAEAPACGELAGQPCFGGL